MEQIKLPRKSFRLRVVRFIGRWLFLFTFFYLGVVVVFWLLERNLVFRPSSAAEWKPPVNPRTEDISLVAADGTKLHAWWLPGRDRAAGAFIHAHGNGGNLSHRGQFAADLQQATGAGVLMFEYPGYGKSEGKPTEEGCYAAGEAAFEWLTRSAGFPAERIVLMGESLGGGTAVELATRHEHRALVLIYTFTSLPAAAKSHFPFLPTKQLMRTRFDNLSKIGRCHRPVFIAHDPKDEVIPFSHSLALFGAAKPPKEFLQLDGHGHHLPKGDTLCVPIAKFLVEKAPLRGKGEKLEPIE
ncbi:MAG TPA: alpha/beta hydrolase [Gemmata sp.]|jgi:fermentation-respiration switch protein FrsA (DUF1100 family)|nr:alpha/beta hydrolase [Gemmata sp.]